MSDMLTPPTPTRSDASDHDPVALGRRHLLRGGAVLAGAAGVAIVGAAATTQPASAATGQFMVVGQPNSADLSTTITTTNAATTPTLRLVSTTGPTLSLYALSTETDIDLEVGEIANTTEGPLIGVDYGSGTVTDALLTTHSIFGLPFTVPFPPSRVLDTRASESRDSILSSSTGAFDTSGRLRAGAWMEVGLLPTDGLYTLEAAFLNVTVASPLASGHLTVYPAGSPEPLTSTLNYRARENTCNSAFIGTSVVQDMFAVRVSTTKTTHVVLDFTGATVTLQPSAPPPRGQQAPRHPGPAAAAKAVRRALS